MQVSNASKEEIINFIIGNNDKPWKTRTGKDLVTLFQSLGFRDDCYNNGLPTLNNKNLRTSKAQYVRDRLFKITDTDTLKKLIEQLVDDSQDKCKATELINDILSLDNIHLCYKNGNLIWEGIRSNAETKNNASFINNERQVIDAINSAKVSILVAMAWFTNQNIKNALYRKLQEGLRIEIVIYNDGVNKAHGVDLSQFDYIERRGSRGGLMHHKFCVIDNQKTITGSYNWTTNAEYRNNENVLITEDNETATKYSIEFRKLKPLM